MTAAVESNIVSRLSDAAARHPDRLAIADARSGVTFGELHARVASAGEGLAADGVHAGDRVLVFVPMSVDLYITLLGTLHAGAVAVFVDAWADRRRLEAAVRAVYLYRKLIASQPTVFIGDTNSNSIWDAQREQDRNHTALVNRLSELGLVSAYHAFFNEAHGRETQPTYYFQWKQAKAFHLDYCFIPKAWLPALRKVWVEPYETWRAHSDHRPLMVDID